jgi:hypothetical protein
MPLTIEKIQKMRKILEEKPIRPDPLLQYYFNQMLICAFGELPTDTIGRRNDGSTWRETNNSN